jgi:hypothetical protein
MAWSTVHPLVCCRARQATAPSIRSGAPELLQDLAQVVLGPGVEFPPMDDPPPGYITHIAVERIGGVDPRAG